MSGQRADRLANSVRIYQRKHAPRLAAYLDYFASIKSLEDAIRYACHGKDGKMHRHQFRVGAATLEEARMVLQRHAAKIAACKVFDDLLGLVADRTRQIDRFGELAVYDTSLRLGAHLGLLPMVVYLHAGTWKVCKALGISTKCGTVDMAEFSSPVQVLTPYEAEDFLCIFKGRLSRRAEEPGTRTRSGCC